MAKKSGKVTAKKAAAKSSKSSKAKRGKLTAATPRQLKTPVKLPNAWQLCQTSARLLWQHKRLFAGIAAVYGLLDIILVPGLTTSIKTSNLATELSQSFGALQVVGTYQFVLTIIGSLAIIWALRQVLAGHQLRVRDAYYRGMYPLVPFVLVLLVIGLQLLPLLIGAAILSYITTSGIAVLAIEKIFWWLVFGLLASWTLYMLSVSLMALYAVTLPDVAPLQALRSAKQLVRRRRLLVLRKILILPVILLLIAAIIMVPILLVLTGLAQWVFFVLSMLALVATHTYLYSLYRELIDE